MSLLIPGAGFIKATMAIKDLIAKLIDLIDLSKKVMDIFKKIEKAQPFVVIIKTK